MAFVICQLDFPDVKLLSVWKQLPDGEPDAYFRPDISPRMRTHAVNLMSNMGESISWRDWGERLWDRGPWPDQWDVVEVDDDSDLRAIYERLKSTYGVVSPSA